MKILSILPLMLFAVLAVSAQEAVTYRGAFAPAPTRQWTESWTEFSPETRVYPTTTDTLSGTISVNTTLTANKTYLLNGAVYVDSLVTLTIEPGTVLRGAKGVKSFLLVQRGGKINADGTQCKPIVFTSNEAVNARTAGDWAGVILLGKARHNLGVNNLIEGLLGTSPKNFHGGTDDADNSGVLRYVRIEYAGEILSTNNELNALTMGSVGNGTTLDYIQTSWGKDDSFEWFGGSVNAKHLIAYKGLDDDLDTDNGYSGTVQFALCIKDPNQSDISDSEGFESDNSATGNNGLFPKTSARFLNVTQIGGFRCASNTAGSGVAPSAIFRHKRGARVRRNSDLKIQNSILMNNWRGLFIDSATVSGQPTAPVTANYDEDSAVYRNNIIAGDFTTTWTGTTYAGTTSLAYENAATRTRGTNVIYANDSLNTCDLLVDPWNANPNNADFRPNSAGAGSIVTSAFASAGDLTPVFQTDGPLFNANQAIDFTTSLVNAGTAVTNGAITITIFKPLGWNITFSPTASSVNVFGGTAVVNSNWTITDNGSTITAVSKPGITIAAGSDISLGFTATRQAGTGAGTNASIGFEVIGGGDITSSGAITGLSAN